MDNLDNSKGRVAFMSSGIPAWHGLGTILDHPPTAREAIISAALDYDVELAQCYANLKQLKKDMTKEEQEEGNGNVLEEGLMVKVANRYVPYRTDVNYPFGTVGSKYTVVQNVEAFTFFDSIVGDGKATYETAGALQHGAKIFITAKLPDNMVVGLDDVTEKYLLLYMSHDGSGSIQVMFTPIRVVCQNTLHTAMRKGSHRISIRHTKSAEENLKKAHKIMGIVTNLTEEYTVLLNQLAKVYISDNEAMQYFRNVFYSNEELKRIAEGEDEDDVVSAIKRNNVARVNQYFHGNKFGQDMITCRGTIYGAYNAVTGYYNNVKKYNNREARMINLTEGDAHLKGNFAMLQAVQLMEAKK